MVRLASVLAIVVVLLAGCGGQTSTAEPVQTTQVTMPPSYVFEPPAIQVPAGTTVTWLNNDHFTHTVSVADGTFPVLNLAPEQSGTITFDQPGTYAYICYVNFILAFPLETPWRTGINKLFFQ